MIMSTDELHKIILRIQEILVAVSRCEVTFKDEKINNEFSECRSSLLSNERTRNLLPEFVKNFRELSSFWSYIKKVSSTFEGRTSHITDSFNPLFEFLEKPQETFPLDELALNTLQVSNEYIKELWTKCLERRVSDPEGAITASRTFLESTCRFILDSLGETYEKSDDLPQLFKKTTKVLNLAPSEHTEQPFKQMISGGFSIVNGLSSLRNNISDSHAISNAYGRPSHIHSTLCVNLAGVISSFLLSTFDTIEIPY